MNKKLIMITLSTVIVAALVVTGVLAFSMGNADGVWDFVDGIADPNLNAYCTTYGTGPGDETTARSRNNPAIQGALGGIDENQVRYGRGVDYDTCPDTAPGEDRFNAQSGLGFDGNNNIGASLVKDVPFLIGRMTHYNNPIYITESGGLPAADGWQWFRWIDIDVQITGITCGNGQPPTEGSTFVFKYRVWFDETPNTLDPCPYGGANNQGVNINGCADSVILSPNPSATSFQCTGPGEPVPGTYTVSLTGLIPHTSADCSTQVYNPNLLTWNFLTVEETTNDACLWAEINDFEPTAVTLKDFTAEFLGDEVLLTWETTSQVNTLGFNLHRALGEDGEQSQVNADLIISSLTMGSIDGASYQFNDESALPSGTYYYWLEEVELDGDTHRYGPVSIVIE